MQDQIDLIMKSFIADCGYEPASEMFDRLSPGKKLRSKLLLNIAQKDEKSLRLCAIIELIQAASLLHDDVIETGMVFTIEPMLTLGGIEWEQWDDGWTVVTKDRSRTAQFEHTLVVTEDGAEVLTLP